MRKISKKMISIFLSVVLVMGIFSLILPTANFAPNVKAEAVAKTYDYEEVLNGLGNDTGINDTRVWDVGSTDFGTNGLASWETVLTKIRDYAKTHARRGYVLVNGHNHTFAFAKENTTQMLVDFTASPLRLVTANSSDAYSESFQNVGLITSSDSDAAYITNFTGYTTPSGYQVTGCYPYLLEFDNFEADGSDDAVYGYDEISWYANQKASDRHIFLTTIVNNVAGLSAANGHVALPGKRSAFISANGASEYLTYECNGTHIYNKYYSSSDGGANIPLWDAKVAGDIEAIRAAFDSLN